jgi:hypothetical protein
MRPRSLAAMVLLLLLDVSPALATIDSWISVSYPLADIHETGRRCEARTIALDPVTNGPESAARVIAGTLSSPIVVPNPIGTQGATSDANAITDGAKADMKATFRIDDWSTPVVDAKLAIDVAALAAANGDAPDGRTDTVRRAKQLVGYALRNFFAVQPKARVTLEITGLPNQDGLPGLKLPAAPKTPVSAPSPLLRDLSAELKPATRGCP